MGQGPFEVVPNEDHYVQFVLYEADGSALNPTATLATGDFKVVEDGGTLGNVINFPTNEGGGAYRVLVDSTQVTTPGTKTTILCRDQTATQDWLDTSIDIVVLRLDEVASRFYSGSHGPGIHVDSGGSAGTVLGVNGTPANPVTTWASALTLAGKLGINRFYIDGGTSVTMTGSVADYEFVGSGEFSSNTVNLGNQLCNNAHFSNLKITGTQNSSSARAEFHECLLSSVTSIHAAAFRCGIQNTISFSVNDDNFFDGCFSAETGGTTPTFSLTSNVDIDISHWSGDLQFANAGSTNEVDLEGFGELVIAASCSSFTINVRGAFVEEDNGTGTTIENTASYNRTTGGVNANLTSVDGVSLASHTAGYVPSEPLLTTADKIKLYCGYVWYSSGSGYGGSTLGVNGLPGVPCNTVSDVYTLLGTTGLRRVMVVDSGFSMDLDGGLYGDATFSGVGSRIGNVINLEGSDYSDVLFENLSVTGSLTGDIECIDCYVPTLGPTGYVGIYDSTLNDTHTLGAATNIQYINCSTYSVYGTDLTLDMTGNSSTAIFRNFSGAVTLTNMDGTNAVDIDGFSSVTIDATCTGGQITIRGAVNLIDESGGAVTIVLVGDEVPFVVTDSGYAPTTTSFKVATDPFEDNIPVGRIMVFNIGTTLAGHKTMCLAWDSDTQVVTVEEMPAAPADGDTGKWE